MKNVIKKVVLFLFISFGLTSFVYAYEVGDKVYKEVVVKGETVSKWLVLEGIVKYDVAENSLYCKFNDREAWAEYDSKGNLIYQKCESVLESFEEWHEYDSKGNKIHSKYSDGYEDWYEYDSKEKIIHEKNSNDYECWYEYDDKGKIIHEKASNGYEYWCEYDDKGKIIHGKKRDGSEIWYEYYYYPNGKLKQELRWTKM